MGIIIIIIIKLNMCNYLIFYLNLFENNIIISLKIIILDGKKLHRA